MKALKAIITLLLLALFFWALVEGRQEQDNWIPCRSEKEFNEGKCGVNR